MKNCLGLINLSESGDAFGALCQGRPVAMLPFGGRYRVIDFTLSNMVNSGITGIGVFTGNKVRSVMDHLGSGGPWDLDRKINGLFLFTPTSDYTTITQKVGDLDLFYQNRHFVEYAKQDTILMTKSYMIGNIDFSEAYADFIASDADISIVYKRVEDTHNRFIGNDKLTLDAEGRFVSIGTNLGMEPEFNLSLEMYFVKKSVYLDFLYRAVERGEANYMRQAMFSTLKDYKVRAFAYDGYIACMNTVRNYFEANMQTLNAEISEELFFKHGHIFTKVKDEPSTYYKRNAKMRNVFVANGCQIDGFVENSIIFRGVKIGTDSVVRNSIVMQKTHIEDNAHLNYVILDKRSGVRRGVTLVGDPSSPYVGGKKSVITREGAQ